MKPIEKIQSEESICLSTADNEIPKRIGLNKTLVMVALVGTIGNSIPTGYNLGVINMPQVVLQGFCNQSLIIRNIQMNLSQLDLLWAFVVSLFLAGAMIGSLCAGYLANTYGRKWTLLLNSVIGLFSAALFAFCKIAVSVEMLLIARLLVGFFSGLGSSVVPMYLMEMTPLHLRGAFGVLQQLGLTTGIFISQILGQKHILGGDDSWPILLSLFGGMVAFGFIVLILFCPKSPSYLFIHKNNEREAIKELEKLRGKSKEELKEDIKILRIERKSNRSNPDFSLGMLFKRPELRRPLFLVCALHGGQQFSGISAVFYYSTTTYQDAGMTEEESQYGSMAAGAVNVLMACLAVLLVQRYKRRTLLVVSTSGVSICLVLLTVTFKLQHLASWIPYTVIAASLSFVGIYGVGLG